MREDSRVLNCLAIADCIGMIGESPPLQAEAGNHSLILGNISFDKYTLRYSRRFCHGFWWPYFLSGLYIPPNQEGLARSMRWKEFRRLKPLTT